MHPSSARRLEKRTHCCTKDFAALSPHKMIVARVHSDLFSPEEQHPLVAAGGVCASAVLDLAPKSVLFVKKRHWQACLEVTCYKQNGCCCWTGHFHV